MLFLVNSLARNTQTAYLRLDRFVCNRCRSLCNRPLFCLFAIHRKQSKIRVWIVVISSLRPTICNPNVHSAKPVVFSMCKAEVSTGVDAELTTDFFVGCNYVFVVSLFECGIIWQSGYTLDPTYLIQYTFDCEIDVEEIKRTHLLLRSTEQSLAAVARS